MTVGRPLVLNAPMSIRPVDQRRPSKHDSHLPFMSPVIGRQLSWGRLAVALWLNSGAYASPFGPSRDDPGLLRESHDRFGDRWPRATQDLYRSIVNRAAAPRRQDLVSARPTRGAHKRSLLHRKVASVVVRRVTSYLRKATCGPTGSRVRRAPPLEQRGNRTKVKNASRSEEALQAPSRRTRAPRPVLRNECCALLCAGICQEKQASKCPFDRRRPFGPDRLMARGALEAARLRCAVSFDHRERLVRSRCAPAVPPTPADCRRATSSASAEGDPA